jgi:hypothetical protein
MAIVERLAELYSDRISAVDPVVEALAYRSAAPRRAQAEPWRGRR